MFKRIIGFFKKVPQNGYLASHGYYRSFDRKQRVKTYGKYPYLPYSLYDFLKSRPVRNKHVLVLSHGDTARWFYHNGRNTVSLGRPHKNKNGNPSKSLNYLDSVRDYTGEALDLLIVDGNMDAASWEHLKGFLKPDSVLIVVHSRYKERSRCVAMEQDLFENKAKVLAFCNPAPAVDELFAELYYNNENFLGI